MPAYGYYDEDGYQGEESSEAWCEISYPNVIDVRSMLRLLEGDEFLAFKFSKSPSSDEQSDTYFESMISRVYAHKTMINKIKDEKNRALFTYDFRYDFIEDQAEHASVEEENVLNSKKQLDDATLTIYAVVGTTLEQIEKQLEDIVETMREKNDSETGKYSESVDGWLFIETGENVPHPDATNSRGIENTANLATLQSILLARKTTKSPIDTYEFPLNGIIAFDTYQHAMSSNVLSSVANKVDIVGVRALGPKLVYDANIIEHMMRLFIGGTRYVPSFEAVSEDPHYFENRARNAAKQRKLYGAENYEEMRKAMQNIKNEANVDKKIQTLTNEFWNSSHRIGAKLGVFSPAGWVASHRTRKDA